MKRHNFLAVAGLYWAIGPALDTAWAREAAADRAGSETSEQRRFCPHLHGQLSARTELFFGLSKPDGTVSEAEFQQFMDTEVTPRFPEGLTLIAATGQYQNAAGSLVQEGSKLLILLYPFSKKDSSAVEEIREAYKAAFQQESVLRVDEQSCVSF